MRRCTRRRFHGARMLVWAAQIPIALVTELKNSVPYVIFLSLAALVESAATDYDQARNDERNAS